jgi:magnesium transporter
MDPAQANPYELLLNIVNLQDISMLTELFEEYYAIDIALALEDFEDDDLTAFIRLAVNEQIAAIVEEGDEELQIRIINQLEPRRIVDVFTHMSNDDIADVLGELSLDLRKELLLMMKASDSIDIQQLLGYGPETAGGIMTTQYIALKHTLTIKEALDKIKTIGPKTEVIETLFILNESNELIGTADLRDILIAPEDSLLNEITDENLIAVQTETDQEDVALLVSKYDLKAIPVINRKNAILGIVTLDDIIDVIVDEYSEDLLMLSGVSKDETIDSTLGTSIKRRLPWLFINLITAFLAAFTVGLFEDVIIQVVALAAAMPIVAGMGGNSGSQTLSIVIRGIALGEVNLKDDWQLVIKEILLGVIQGLSTGAITAIILYIRYDNLFLGLIIMAAMTCNMIIAGFFGFLIPLILKRLKIDPAVSSAIFLTTATDVFGFFIFLGLAKLFLPYLL